MIKIRIFFFHYFKLKFKNLINLSIKYKRKVSFIFQFKNEGVLSFIKSRRLKKEKTHKFSTVHFLQTKNINYNVLVNIISKLA